MTESELADYFYTHRDDPAGEEVESQTPQRMDVMVSARFSQDEAAALRTAAEGAKMSVSAFIRQRVLAALDTNVIDLDRVRADIVDMQSKAADVLLAIGQKRLSPPRRSTAPKRRPANV